MNENILSMNRHVIYSAILLCTFQIDSYKIREKLLNLDILV